MNTNIIVIGLGSMGKRRIRLIKDMHPEFQIAGVDLNPDRRKESEEKYNIKTYNSIDEIENPKSVDCAFICTSPLSHAAIIKECLQKNMNVFTELNLVSDGYNENMKLAEQKNKILFLSSTHLYSDDIRFIINHVKAGNKWNYIYHVGQYLPDWHPWESYKDFFIGNKRTNACREIMAIELPWLVNAYGKIKSYKVAKSKNTTLDINYNDNYIIELEHENQNKGVFVVDVVSPVAVRKFETYRENEYITWNGTPESLKIFNSSSHNLEKAVNIKSVERINGYADFVIENDYRNEIKEFFDVVYNNKKAAYGFKEDMQILNLIDKLER